MSLNQQVIAEFSPCTPCAPQLRDLSIQTFRPCVTCWHLSLSASAICHRLTKQRCGAFFGFRKLRFEVTTDRAAIVATEKPASGDRSQLPTLTEQTEPQMDAR